MQPIQTISTQIHSQFYEDKNLIHLAIKAFVIAFSPRPFGLAITLPFLIILWNRYSNPPIFQPFDVLGKLIDPFMSIIAAIVGFMLISFSLIIVHINRGNAFRDFTQVVQSTGIPPLRYLLLHFVFPSIYFTVILLAFTVVKIALVMEVSVNARLANIINAMVFIFVLSQFLYLIYELIAYFFNIYQYISTIAKKESEAFELTIRYKIRDGIELAQDEKAFETQIRSVLYSDESK